VKSGFRADDTQEWNRLGLTIVRDTVQDLGGEVGASEHSELGVLRLVVRLPIWEIDYGDCLADGR